MPWPKGRPRDTRHLREYQFKKGEVNLRTKESYRRGFYNGAANKLYDGLSFTQKGIEAHIRNVERRRMEKEIKNTLLFEEKYGALFEDNRTSAWEEEQQEDSLQQKNE